MAIELNNLASLYQSQNRLDQSEEVYRRALGIFEKSAGQERQGYAKTLKSYASLLRRKQRTGEAERLEERAKSVLKRLSLENQNRGNTAGDLPQLLPIP